jgi:hypothetical protein
MADKKKKPTLALVISVGPKMKTKPTDAATPDMKKYGSIPMKKSWVLLKETIDMHEYPKDSGNFMSLEEMIHARNADTRRALVTGQPQTTSAPRPVPRQGYSGWM